MALDAMPTRTGTSPDTPTTPSRSSIEGRFPIGSILGDRYRILRALGRGGMGEVYHAHDGELDQEVALKFLPESARDPSQLKRFRAEVRLARRVSHPNVCRVYDIGVADGAPFISMEYVDGEDLRSLLRRIGRFPGDRATEIARRLSAGLAAAHAVGVLHRDLKPANIMIDGEGQVKVMDFGLADLAGGVEDVRSGTPAYMAPEQAAGDEVTALSDIYALGLVLYEMYTGRKAFDGSGDRSSPPSASESTADVDPAVARLIQRCLEPDPSRRPASALDVARALPGGDPLAEALAAGETPSPEMVAASKETGVLSVRSAVICLGVILASLVAVFALDSRTDILTLLPAPDSPDVLVANARELAERMGYTDEIADSGYGFEYELDLQTWAAENGIQMPELRAMAAQGGPSPVTFWYRQSPVPMSPVNAYNVLGPEDPPTLTPGMVTIRTDLGNRLLTFLAVPEGGIEGTGPSLSFDELLGLAGFDPVRDCRTATPTLALPIGRTGERAAWSCSYAAAPELNVNVEAASSNRRPVYFGVIGPWEGPAPPFSGITAAFVLSVLTGAALLARGNYRRGRGDFQGALRLASFGFLTFVVLSLTRSHGLFSAAGDPGVPKLFPMVGMALLIGAMLWVLYVALEPYVRRRWPQSLISWRRLLAGRWGDSIVGGHVLVGTAAGMAVSVASGLLESRIGLLPSVPSQGALSGAGPTIGVAAEIVSVSAFVALSYFLAYFLLFVILRKAWLTGAVAFPIVVGLSQADPDIPNLPLAYSLFFGALTVGLGVFLVSRFGVLTLATSFVVNFAVRASPMVPDFSTWYAQVTIMALVIVLGLTAWSFHAALGGRRLLREDFLES